MKYLSFFSVFFAAILLFGACANKDKLSKEDSNKNDTIYGLVGPGTSMHSLQVCQTHPVDTLWFVICDSTDVTNANLLIGNKVEVIYKKDKDMNIAKTIIGNATYVNAVGSWVMPDPIKPDDVMGINIDIDGKASSIRMATLVYQSWELTKNENQIVLHGESIGNNQSFAFTDTATIKKVDGELTLQMQATGIIYKKEL